MSPERILEIAECVEARIYPEFNTTTDRQRWLYLNERLDHCAFLRCCSWLKAQGMELPSLRRGACATTSRDVEQHAVRC